MPGGLCGLGRPPQGQVLSLQGCRLAHPLPTRHSGGPPSAAGPRSLSWPMGAAVPGDPSLALSIRRQATLLVATAAGNSGGELGVAGKA